MPSDSKKRKEQQKKEARKKNNKKPNQDEDAGSSDEQNGDLEITNGESTRANTAKAVDELCNGLDKFSFIEKTNAENRACTGVLSSHPNGRDIHIDQFSLTFYGQELLVDSRLELNNGRRYGIIGLNGELS
jgi:ATP-binding cassette subfamily F protein 2